MKTLPPLLLAALTAGALAQITPEIAPLADIEPDPTLASPQLRAALSSGGSAIPEMTVKGLVIGAERAGGTVLFELPGGSRVVARPGNSFSVIAGGATRRLIIKSISGSGIEIEAPDSKETAVLPTFGPVRESRGGIPSEVAYVEFRDLPLLDALRLLSDQTDRNFSASAEANKIPVNVMLRNVSASAVVEEICKSHGLWFRRDPESGILRIMTVGEFEKDLIGFREEQTAVFTLKFPNVPAIATAIADLYGDRVQLSLAAEELDNEARRDLEERFDRFQILTERTETTGALNGNIVGNNVNGFVSNAGRNSRFGPSYDTSRGGRGSDNISQRNRYDRQRTADRDLRRDEDQLVRTITAEQADRLDRADRSGEAAPALETLRKRPANIFITANRRSNLIAVRTSDARALADIRALVQRMDVQTPLVLMEVKVLSIELGKGFESAFDYAVSNGKFGGSFSTNVINPSVVVDPITRQPTGTASFPDPNTAAFRDGQFIFQFLGDSVRARLQLLATKNRVKTLATPTLLTANNEVSRLFLGEERPLVRGINSQTILTENNVATTPNTMTEFRNIGNTLLITPSINADRTVTLRLVQENSFISPNAASIPVVTTTGRRNGVLGGANTNTEVQNVPVDVVGTRSVSGTFIAKDGMAVAIGGLIEDVDNDRRAGVPILSDIPGIGVLFRRQNTEKSRRELVIILCPYVLSTPADSERLSRDVLDRIAPESMEKLREEGFFPDLPLLPPEPVIVEVRKATPNVPPDTKIVHPPRK